MSYMSHQEARPPLPLPPPEPWTVVLSDQRQLDEQVTQALAAAARLRSHAEAIAGIVQHVAAHDRPDVWSGGRADEFRRQTSAISTRLLAPWAGVADQIRTTAARIEARAGEWQTQVASAAPCGTPSTSRPLEAFEAGCPVFAQDATPPR